MSYSIEKKFTGFPFAHRQHNHEGKCRLVHGHNWDFAIRLESDRLDEIGFVYDFGKFKWLRQWLTDMFDHTCVINADDPLLEDFERMHAEGLIQLRVVPCVSAEGLAKLVYEYANQELGELIVSVSVWEDEKNQATYEPGR